MAAVMGTPPVMNFIQSAWESNQEQNVEMKDESEESKQEQRAPTLLERYTAQFDKDKARI